MPSVDLMGVAAVVEAVSQARTAWTVHVWSVFHSVMVRNAVMMVAVGPAVNAQETRTAYRISATKPSSAYQNALVSLADRTGAVVNVVYAQATVILVTA